MLEIKNSMKFKSFVPDRVSDIINDFRKTGKYNKKFLKDLERGLKKSSFNSRCFKI